MSMQHGCWIMDDGCEGGGRGEGEQLGRTIDMNENPLQMAMKEFNIK